MGALAFNSVFTFRRFVFAFSLVFLGAFAGFQMQLFFFQSLSMIAYLTAFRPFEDTTMTGMEIFNEVTILAISYCLVGLADSSTDAYVRFNIGWAIIGLTLFNILTNICVLLILSVFRVKDLITKLSSYHLRWRQRKYRK